VSLMEEYTQRLMALRQSEISKSELKSKKVRQTLRSKEEE